MWQKLVVIKVEGGLPQERTIEDKTRDSTTKSANERVNKLTNFIRITKRTHACNLRFRGLITDTISIRHRISLSPSLPLHPSQL
jgi:hypothetical protein